jgi:hypothetical protein
MEYRSQKVACFLLTILVLAPCAAAAEYSFRVRHERLLRDHAGFLSFTETGVTYREVNPKKPEDRRDQFKLAWQDVQQLWLSPSKVVVLLYTDRPWLLGVDREYEFYLDAGQNVRPVYAMLKDKLDQRFVAALADPPRDPLARIPAKLTRVLSGAEGTLVIAKDRVVFETAKNASARTWRLEDIDNIYSSGPFDLTLVTFERAVTGYGARKEFHFQLKQRLDAAVYESLWRRLNQNKGLPYLNSLLEAPAR